MPKTQVFARMRNLERAFADFKRRGGHPDSETSWGKIESSRNLDYAKSLNDFGYLIPDGKFPPRDHFIIFCALVVYGKDAIALWRKLREHYVSGRPRGANARSDEAFDLWYAIDAWLQQWLYKPMSCPRPAQDHPSDWLRCIGTTNPTPHLRISYAFLRQKGIGLPANYVNARRELLDVKGVLQRYAIVPTGSEVPNTDALLYRFPLIGWDIWQRSVYLLTNDVKPPSHMPIFGWRHSRLLNYVETDCVFGSREIEKELLGHERSLCGPLWPSQTDTLKKLGKVKIVGPPITSGRMLRRILAH